MHTNDTADGVPWYFNLLRDSGRHVCDDLTNHQLCFLGCLCVPADEHSAILIAVWV